MNITREHLSSAVDQIEHAPYSLQVKIVRLYVVTQLNYRGPVGDRAWEVMNQLAGAEQTSAIAFLSGCLSFGPMNTESLLRLCPEADPTPRPPVNTSPA